jgi:hypothetical protein
MTTTRTKEDLLDFLDYLADKGLMARATVQARKAAASTMLGILEKPESDDVTAIDLDDLAARYSRLHGKRYNPQSLNTYKGRLRSAIDDFTSYLANPMAFRPALQSRERKPAVARAVQEGQSGQAESKADPVRATPFPMAASNILPIPIRADLTIYIQGLPFDLSKAEAGKIAAVVSAMAQGN